MYWIMFIDNSVYISGVIIIYIINYWSHTINNCIQNVLFTLQFKSIKKVITIESRP